VRAVLKFLGPLRGRNPTSLPLMLMLGHCHLLNTQYSEALGEYFHAYRRAARAAAATAAVHGCACTRQRGPHSRAASARVPS
jgi:cytochrome c-type biogenesis protein CcmH/NrfG